MPLGETGDAEREALRRRQGKGARYDAETAPAEDLLLARRGAAYFARMLNELSDRAFDAPSLRDGWTRRHLVAYVSHRARALALALKGMREGLTREEAGWRPDIELAATLPVAALRHLYTHSDVHLNVEFRDLTGEHWEGEVVLPDGVRLPVRETPMLRARDVWLGAVDLGTGARAADLPEPLRDEIRAVRAPGGNP